MVCRVVEGGRRCLCEIIQRVEFPHRLRSRAPSTSAWASATSCSAQPSPPPSHSPFASYMPLLARAVVTNQDLDQTANVWNRSTRPMYHVSQNSIIQSFFRVVFGNTKEFASPSTNCGRVIVFETEGPFSLSLSCLCFRRPLLTGHSFVLTRITWMVFEKIDLFWQLLLTRLFLSFW